MVDIIGYLSVLFMVIISGAGLYPDFLTNTTWKIRIALAVLLFAAACSALYMLHEGNSRHSEDVGRIKGLENAVRDAGDRQQASAKQFIQGQKEATAAFASKYDDLSARLSALQTGIKTADLQQEANGLRKELKATQNALVVPKAKLTLSLKDTMPATLTESLPVHDNTVHISFLIRNLGSTDALNGDIVLLICGACSYAKEPPPFVKVNGAPDNQRNYSFRYILAHTQAPFFEVDLKVPADAMNVAFGVKVICHTCEPVPLGRPSPDMTAHIALLR